MKIVVCVSDEVLNSQHYKHSQSTEASDQYANTLQIIYRKSVEIQFLSIFTNTVFIFHFQKQTYNWLHVILGQASSKYCLMFHSDFDAESINSCCADLSYILHDTV